jgi:hypothetical protein
MSPLLLIICATFLFIALSPGLLFSFPKRGTLIKRVLMHAAIFATLLYGIYVGTCNYVFTKSINEGFTADIGKIVKDGSNNTLTTSLNLNGTNIPLVIKLIEDGTFSITSDENIIIDVFKNPSNYFTKTSNSIALSSLSNTTQDSSMNT